MKVLLLDLYVAWNTDPKLEIGVHMSPNSYTLVKRYNQLYITRTIIDVVTVLRNYNVIGFHKGSEANHRISRIWSSPILENYFKNIRLSIFDINQNKELIVLRDNDKKDIDYKDNSKIKDMRGVLEKYNELLRQTFIDIPFLEKPYLQYKGKKHNVNQHSKLVKRIFSKGSFNKGGRFYGGWWQRIGEKERENILMDDRETLEFDYTSLHPVLAYAKIGIDISINQFDAYDIPFDRIKDKKDKRKIVKSLFLTALNAKNEKECFKAFRNQWNYIEHPYVGSFSDIF